MARSGEAGGRELEQVKDGQVGNQFATAEQEQMRKYCMYGLTGSSPTQL